MNTAVPQSVTGYSNRLLRTIVFLALTASLLWAAIGTIHWPIVGDAPLLHYVVFLHDRGMAPYTQAVDMNLPGTYALQWMAVHLFGRGPLAWRCFDYALILLCGISMIRIAIDLEIDWLAAATSPAIVRISPTVCVSPSTIADKACISLSSKHRSFRSTVRSPREIFSAAAVISFIASISVFRLFLIRLKSPLYSSVIRAGTSPLLICSTYRAETCSGPITASSVPFTPSTTFLKSP